VYSYVDGSKYVGSFLSGRREGFGTYVWPDKTKYEGNYHDNHRHGQGTFTWPDGEKYIGSWREGMKQGEGVYTYAADKSEMKGTWENDVANAPSRGNSAQE